MDVDRLESIAQQLVARVRDDDPAANARWLHTVTDEREREALLYLLAAAVPDDRTWNELVCWCTGEREPSAKRRRQWRESKRRARVAAMGSD